MVYVYESEGVSPVLRLGTGSTRSSQQGSLAPDGHTSRVFSLKFDPTDPNILYSGGWDKTVQVCM